MWASSAKYLQSNFQTSVWLNHWDWPGPADTPNWPSQYLSGFFPLKNPNTYTIIIIFSVQLDLNCNVFSVGSKINETYSWYVCMTASRIQRTSFKILTCDMHFPDLGYLGCGAWCRLELEGPCLFSGAVPSSIVSRGFEGLSDVSVWLMVVPAPGVLRPSGLVALILVSDSWSDPKCSKINRKPHFPRVQGRGGACSASSSDPRVVSLKKN